MINLDSATEETPCQQEEDLFASRMLSDFDAVEYLEERASNGDVSEVTEDEILKAQVKHNAAKQATEAMAISLCRKCPVLNECARSVLATEADGLPIYGVAGGMTAKERRKVRNRAAAAV